MRFVLWKAGGKPLDHDVPIHVVTEPSQLPVEFLNPSAAKQLIIGFDCEGVNLCRHGALCIMQVSYSLVLFCARNRKYKFIILMLHCFFVIGFGSLHSRMLSTWLMPLTVESHLSKRVSLHSSRVTSQKLFTIANGIARFLVEFAWF